MKSGESLIFFQGMAFGILLCLTAILAYLYLPAAFRKEREISFEQVITLIKSKKISEVNLKPAEVVVVDKDENKYFTPLDESDAPRESILKAADETATKVNLEPASSGLF